MSNDLPDLPQMGDLPELPDMPAMDGGLPDLGAPMGDMPLPEMGAPDMPLPAMGGAMPAGDAPLYERRTDEDGATYKRSIYALPINVQMVIGSARPKIAELLQLTEGSILTLDKSIDEPVDICVDNRVIARGELIETDPASGELGLRVTEIVDISEDMLS